MKDSKNLTRREAIKRGGAALAALPALPMLDVLPFAPLPTTQPHPAIVWATHVSGGGAESTVITRLWESDPEGKCKLCPGQPCGVYRNVCVVSTNRGVASKDAALYVLPPERKAAKA